VMLVDAQLTRTNAGKSLTGNQETHKPLSLIYITHEHADHFLGLEVFKEAYPGVRINCGSASCVESKRSIRRKSISGNSSCLGCSCSRCSYRSIRRQHDHIRRFPT